MEKQTIIIADSAVIGRENLSHWLTQTDTDSSIASANARCETRLGINASVNESGRRTLFGETRREHSPCQAPELV